MSGQMNVNLDEFTKELEVLINKHAIENVADVPDFIIAEYMANSFMNVCKMIKARDKWFSFKPWSTHEIVSNCEVCKTADVCKIYRNLKEGKTIVKCAEYEPKTPPALVARIDISDLRPVVDLIVKTFKNERIPKDIREVFLKEFNSLLDEKEK